MSMGSQPSVSQWIVGAQRGEDAAVQALWEQYFARLVQLARQKLMNMPCRMVDEEDVALSAFVVFCRAAAAGRFPDLTNRDDLWRLLITLTAQKAIDHARCEGRAKRGGGQILGESVLGCGDSSKPGELADVVGDEPTPEFAASMAEECDRLLRLLNDDLRRIALAKMEDYTNQEIAERQDCSVSTVERGLRLIRKIWRREISA